MYGYTLRILYICRSHGKNVTIVVVLYKFSPGAAVRVSDETVVVRDAIVRPQASKVLAAISGILIVR
jgi:hypothetical protein